MGNPYLTNYNSLARLSGLGGERDRKRFDRKETLL
jgi:hypothetical protein